MSNLVIEEAYYSIPIYEPDQKYLKFQFHRFLYKHTVLRNDWCYQLYSVTQKVQENSPNFQNNLLSELKRVEKIVVVDYFDDLITINSSYASCFKGVTKIIKLFIALRFAVHASKFQFIPSQNIEYLGSVIDSKHVGLFI